MSQCIRIYSSWREETAALADDEKGRLIDALVNYMVTGEAQEPEGNEKYVYPVLISRIRRENETHERRVEERKRTPGGDHRPLVDIVRRENTDKKKGD